MAIGTTNFPASLDTATELIRAVNDARTTIGVGGASSGATTINVTSASGAPSDGIAVIVSATDDTVREIVSYTGKTGTSLTGCTRNLEGSGAKTWAAGDIVYFDTLTALSRSVLVNALLALETKLGIGVSTPVTGQVLTASAAGVTGWAPPAATLVVPATAFSGQSTVSLPASTFTATYRRYLVLTRLTLSANAALSWRLRASGSDDSNASYYTAAAGFGAAAPSNQNSGATAQTSGFIVPAGGTTLVQAFISLWLDAPQAAEVTEWEYGATVRATTPSSSRYFGGGHFNASTQFDALTLIPASGTITGTYSVYGLADS